MTRLSSRILWGVLHAVRFALVAALAFCVFYVAAHLGGRAGGQEVVDEFTRRYFWQKTGTAHACEEADALRVGPL